MEEKIVQSGNESGNESENENENSSRSSNNLHAFLKWVGGINNATDFEEDAPIPDHILHDIKISSERGRGEKEDEVYLTDDEVFEKIRRGNSILENSTTKELRLIRKGLPKFFDYKIDFKNQPNKKGKNGQIYNRVMTPVEDAFDSKRSVAIYRTEKANGQNFQVSYDSVTKCWVIGSKNVTLMAKDETDLLLSFQRKDRQEIPLKFARRWFKFLYKQIIEKGLFEEFCKAVDGKTLVGELVESESQHIKYYLQDDIYFYAVIRNNQDKVCENLDYSQRFFKKFGLKPVFCEKVAVVSSLSEFFPVMEKLYIDIFKAAVEVEGEGNVVYFCSVDEDGKEEVVSLAKLKTFEYRVYRKLREKLKGYIPMCGDYSHIIKSISVELDELLAEETEEYVSKKSYLEFCGAVLENVNKVKFCDTNRYSYFINKQKALFYKTPFVEAIKKEEEDCKPEEKVESKKARMKNEDFACLDKLDKLNKMKSIVFLINYGLPGAGKSTIIEQLKCIITEQSLEDRIKLARISSDDIKGKMIQEILKETPNKGFQKVFKEVTASTKFKTTLTELIRYHIEKMDKSKLNLIALDRNIDITQFQNSLKEIEPMFKKIGGGMKPYFCVFLPKLSSKMKILLKYEFPFSYDYFIQCYLRIANRTDHGTLDPEKNPSFIKVLLEFLNKYRNYETKKVFDFVDVAFYLTYTHERNSSDERFSFIEEELGQILDKISSNKNLGGNTFPITDEDVEVLSDFMKTSFSANEYENTTPIIKGEILEFLKLMIEKAE